MAGAMSGGWGGALSDAKTCSLASALTGAQALSCARLLGDRFVIGLRRSLGLKIIKIVQKQNFLQKYCDCYVIVHVHVFECVVKSLFEKSVMASVRRLGAL